MVSLLDQQQQKKAANAECWLFITKPGEKAF